MVLGFLWYSPVLFGNAWVKLRNMKKEEMKGGGPITYILTALTALGGSFILAFLLTLGSETTWLTGLTIGLLIGLSISLKIGMNYLFENSKLQLYFITIGYHLVSYMIAGIIIGAWQS
jgi:asparagine N-glycosylation enzyme membrane subunit Stt3